MLEIAIEISTHFFRGQKLGVKLFRRLFLIYNMLAETNTTLPLQTSYVPATMVLTIRRRPRPKKSGMEGVEGGSLSRLKGDFDRSWNRRKTDAR